MKRLICLNLVLVMLFSMLPATAMAAEVAEEEKVTVEEQVTESSDSNVEESTESRLLFRAARYSPELGQYDDPTMQMSSEWITAPNAVCIGKFFYGNEEKYIEVGLDQLSVSGSGIQLYESGGFIHIYAWNDGDYEVIYTPGDGTEVKFLVSVVLPNLGFYTQPEVDGIYYTGAFRVTEEVYTLYLMPREGALTDVVLSEEFAAIAKAEIVSSYAVITVYGNPDDSMYYVTATYEVDEESRTESVRVYLYSDKTEPEVPQVTVLDSGVCGDDLTWELTSDGTLTISGTGAMWDYTGSSTPWSGYGEAINKVVVEEGVTALGENAFTNCTSLSTIKFMGDAPAFGGGVYSDVVFGNVVATVYYPADNASWTEEVMKDYGGTLTWMVEEYIIINGTKYDATSDYLSGEGWEYQNSGWFEHALFLTDYDGGSIEANVDLQITVSGNNVVTAEEGYAIYSSGRLTVFSFAGTDEILCAYGGNGSAAIYAGTGLWFVDCNLTLVGGGTSAISGSKVSYWGDWPYTMLVGDSEDTAAEGEYIDQVYLKLEKLPYTLNLEGNGGVTKDGEESYQIIFTTGTAGWLALYKYADVFTKVEKNFVGWSKTSGGDVDYSTNAQYWFPAGSMEESLYAVWAEKDACGSNLEWNLEEWTDENETWYTLYITGSGAMYDVLPGWYEYRDMIRKVVLSDGLTTIGNNAFYECYNLTEIVIPDSVTAIGDYAFSNCRALTEIAIPDSVTTIGSGAFYNCDALSGIVIPDSVKTLGIRAFQSCDALEHVTIGSGLPWIDGYVFDGCSRLTEIVIPAGVTYIGYGAFQGCSALSEISFVGGAPSISYNAFSNVTATCYYPADNTTWTTEVMQQYGGTLTWMAAGGPVTPLTQIPAPTDLTWGRYYYRDYKNGGMIYAAYPGMISWRSGTFDYRHNVEITVYRVTGAPEDELVWSRWWSCGRSDLEYNTAHDFSLSMLEELESGTYYFTAQAIGDETTMSSEIVTSGTWNYTKPDATARLSAPSNLAWDGLIATWDSVSDELVGGYNIVVYYSSDESGADMRRATGFVQYSCEGEMLTFDPDSWWAFEEFGTGYYWFEVKTVSADVNKVMHSDYSKLSAPVYYNDGEEAEEPTEGDEPLSGSFGSSVTWELTDNGTSVDEAATYTLTISGEGWMDVFASIEDQPWAWAREFITKIVVEYGVQNIGDYAFANCWNVTEVEIADSVTVIGMEAFARCSGLTGITIPYGVNGIDETAFLQCNSLTAFAMPLPAGAEAMPCYAVQNGVLYEAVWTYDEEENLWSVERLEGLICYPAGKNNATYEIPATVIHIADNAFYGCYNLTAITVAEKNTLFMAVDGVLYSATEQWDAEQDKYVPVPHTLILYPAGKQGTSFTVPESVSMIGERAFAYAKVSEIIIPALVSIHDYAFEKCGNGELSIIFRSDAVSGLWENAFAGATAICYYPAGSADWEGFLFPETGVPVDNNYGGEVTWVSAYDDTKAVTGLTIKQDTNGEYFLSWNTLEGKYEYRIFLLITDETSTEGVWLEVGRTTGDRCHLHGVPVGDYTEIKVETLNPGSDSAVAVACTSWDITVKDNSSNGASAPDVLFIQMEEEEADFLISVSGLKPNAPYRMIFTKTDAAGESNEWNVTWYTNDNGALVVEINQNTDSGLAEWLYRAIEDKISVNWLIQEITYAMDDETGVLTVSRNACGESGGIMWYLDGDETLMKGYERYAVSDLAFVAPRYNDKIGGIHILTWTAPVVSEESYINTEELDYVVYFYTAADIDEETGTINWNRWTSRWETGSTELDLADLAEEIGEYIAIKVVTRVNGVTRAEYTSTLHTVSVVVDASATVPGVIMYRQSDDSNRYTIKFTGLEPNSFYRFKLWDSDGCEHSNIWYTDTNTESVEELWSEWVTEGFATGDIRYSLQKISSTLSEDGVQHVKLSSTGISGDAVLSEMPAYEDELVKVTNVRFEVEDGKSYLRWDAPEQALGDLTYSVFIFYGDNGDCNGWDIGDTEVCLDNLESGRNYHTIRIESKLADITVGEVVIDMAAYNMSLTVTETVDSNAKLMIQTGTENQDIRFLFSGLTPDGEFRFEVLRDATNPNGPSFNNTLRADEAGACENGNGSSWMEEYSDGVYRIVEFGSTVENDGMSLTIVRSSAEWRDVETAIAVAAAPEIKDVTVGEKLSEKLSEAQTEVVTNVAAKVTVDLVQENVKVKDGLTDEAGNKVEITEGMTVTVTDVSLKIEVTDYEGPVVNEETGEMISTSDSRTLVLDITPVATVTVSKDTTSDVIATKEGAEVNTEGTPVVVTIPLPDGFANIGQPLYVIHTKDDRTEYTHRVEVQYNSAGYYISFVNTQGFSTFIVTNEVVKLTCIDSNGVTQTEIYDSVQSALDNARNRVKDGFTDVTVQLLVDGIEENYLIVTSGVTLDLNGMTLKANYLAAFSDADVVDNSAEKTGLLKVEMTHLMLPTDNSQMPVWNGVDGYVFATITFNQMIENVQENSTTIRFKPSEEEFVTDLITAAVENEQIFVVVTLTWGRNVQTYTYDPAVAAKVFEKGTLTLKVTGIQTISDLKLQAKVISSEGVEIAGMALDAKIAGEQN